MPEYEHTTLRGEYIIKDEASGSRAIFPVKIDEGHLVELYKIDVLDSSPSRSKACDYLMVCDESNYKVTCLTELKGTRKESEVNDAFSQIEASLDELRDAYIGGSSITVGIVVGAPDKTLPRMISAQTRSLCKKLYSQSTDRKKIKNMGNLLIYIQPDNIIRKAAIAGKGATKVIKCHSRSGAHVPIPSMIVEFAIRA